MPGKRAGARSHRSFARQQVGDNLFNNGSCGNNHLRPSSILNHSSVEKLTVRHWNTHSLCNKTWPPPSARNGLLTSVFLREFDEFIDTVHLLPGKLLIMGDLNVHFDLPSKPDVAHVLASVSSADLVQVVTKPIYVHGHILDPLITSVDTCIIDHSIHCNHHSDHAVVCANIALGSPKCVPRTVEDRPYGNIDHGELGSDLTLEVAAVLITGKSSNDIMADFDKSNNWY
ncbi:uncharacterized protein LOC117112465 [Anneissia japonica]|uniref:uncharacterized protein LOC117112465 n=1 Tax=Anneissia japonica TaxID=1529436 RepID=UPI001425A9F2|nr:uncharacterized protein LOC117112465 [Anneissia japonica]